MFLLLGLTLFSLNGAFASNATQNATSNVTILNSTYSAVNSTDFTNGTTNSSSDLAAQNSQQLTDNNSSTTNSSTVQNETNTTNVAAGGNGGDIHGVWISSTDANSITKDALKALHAAGITDIFVKSNLISTPTYDTVLRHVLDLIQENGLNLKVHAWITCFQDANGNWIDPQGAYTYTVQVPYEGWYQNWQQVWYQAWTKSWYKKWYRSHGKWRSYWRYGWQSTWKSYWKLNWVWGQTTFTETRTGYDTTHNTEVINAIKDIVTKYKVAGINLDYCRYPGTAYKHTGATDTITNFVKQVHDAVKAINSNVTVSADLMPEGSVNAYYYGQDYAALAKYLDFMVPMVYKGNYNKNTAWIGSTTAYIVSQANGTPVVTGLQTYKSDSDTTPLPSSQLDNDVNAAMSNGSSGYMLFRYGLIDSQFYGAVDPTNDEILAAAAWVKNYTETNHALPDYVTIDSAQVSMAQFLQLLVTDLLQINNNTTANMTIENVTDPTNPTENVTAGNINETEYLNIAQNIKTFIDSNGRAPNYAKSSLGNIQFESVVYMYSQILNSYLKNATLPNNITINPWSTTTQTTTPTTPTNTVPAWLQQYLQPTKNCQSTDYRITADVAAITSGITDPYAKAVALYNWLHTHENYSFYSNSQKGAVGTLCSGYGNCCDLSNLMVAFARAAGIPARYVHGYCHFSSNWYGHVWAQLYINGQWINADLSSSRNSFGVIRNWNTNTYTLYGYLTELTF
jgi:hypothetical protein